MIKLYLISLLLINFIFSDVKYINSVSVEGNFAIDKNQILKIINTKNPKFLFEDIFNSRKLHLDKISIKNFYRSLGYLEADVDYKVEEINNKKINIIFNIIEGKKHYLDKIELYGNNFFPYDDLMKIINLKSGDVFNPIQLNNSLKEIKNNYLNNGKANVKIVDEIFKEKNGIVIRINISEGETYTIGNLKVLSNETINEQHVLRELLFSSGETYNSDLIIRSQRRIYTSNVFSSVEINQSINKNEKKVNIDINVRKGDSGNITGIFGFAQTPSALGVASSPITIIQGGGKWNISKIYNTGLKMGFDTNIGIRLDKNISLSSMKFEFSFFSPWTFNIRLPLNLKYYFEEAREQGFLRRQGFRTSFLYKKGQKYNLNGTINIENNTTTLDDNPDQERSIQLSYMYFSIKDFLNPKNGRYISSKIDLRGTFLGGSRNYLKIESEYRHFFQIYYGIGTFAIRSKIGYLYDFSTKSQDISNLPYYDRLYLGGSTSLRAWGEGELDNFGGYLKQLLNLEVRLPLFWLVGANLFFDAGKLLNQNTNNTNEYNWNIGYGLTGMSPIGPIRIDFAYQYGSGKPYVTNALLFIF